jgi:hypothetical protein
MQQIIPCPNRGIFPICCDIGLRTPTPHLSIVSPPDERAVECSVCVSIGHINRLNEGRWAGKVGWAT